MDMTTPMQPKPLVNATCKLGEKGCFKDGRCHALGDCENKIVTNADKIRAMTDKELAYWIMCPYDSPYCIGTDQCIECTLEWLKQPAEEETP